MPTNPLETVLSREISRIQAKGILVDVLPLFEELINYGTNVLIRCTDSPTTSEKGIDVASLALYRHVLQMTDGLHVLLSDGVSQPALPILRSIFEALLSLEFILESNMLYRRRSLQWLTFHLRDQLSVSRSLLKEDELYKQFRAKIENDKTINSFPDFPQEQLKITIGKREDLLKQPRYTEIEAEVRAFKEKWKRRPKWFSLFDGPRSLEQLANELKRPVQYDVLYRQWSKVTHAQDFTYFFHTSPEGETGIRGLRDPSRLIDYSRFGLVFIIDSTKQLLGKFRPDEDYSNYYKREIYPRFRTLLPK